MVVSVHPVDSSAITRNKGFSPSAYEYTNKTMHFQVADPYEGYNTWTYSYTGGQQQPSSNHYVMTTDIASYSQYFGYDEFSSQEDIICSVLFESTLMAGTYRFQPIIYTYQKTVLETSTVWAVAINWAENNLQLIHNTANGSTPTTVPLASVSPELGNWYYVQLTNSGNTTSVLVYDIPFKTIIYSGSVTTFNYNATALYAGIGQYSSGSGNINGIWDNFTIVDSSLYYEVIPAGALWGLDVSLIILGLCMIPASTLYLAYGIKHDRSDDRLFYGLILFFMGCGLFIGGILP